MEKITAKAPWLPHMGEVPAHLVYFEGSLFQAVEQTAKKYPKAIALDFMGSKISYAALCRNIRRCAGSLQALGLGKGDRLTIAMPNCPQAIYLFYAVNLIGGIANMIHPLSAEKEVEFYLRQSGSIAAVTLDQFYPKFAAIRENTDLRHLLLVKLQEAMPPLTRLGYALTQGRKTTPVPGDAPVLWWQDFLAGSIDRPFPHRDSRQNAVILYSGGTTGTTKGILLSDRNFNALSQQVIAANPMFRPGDKMLAAMPIFHGFGLGVCIHTMLSQGGRCVLVPRFTPQSYAKQLLRCRCSFIAGVPTLYEALLRLDTLEGKSLHFLKGVFSGGDNLSVALKQKLDRFLADHGAGIQVREGYGATEAVAACCLTPPHRHKEGSIGLPFPDTYVKIVAPGTDRELPYGQEGEILLSGPTVMLGYMDDAAETAQALRTHADGLTWLYTGDLGTMDREGFLYFKGRVKRMIVSSGYNIYPVQLENILDAHPAVLLSCVVGIPDAYKMQKVKAFVQLQPGTEATEAVRQSLWAHCRRHIARYAMPCEIEFCQELPKTLVGKIAYRELEKRQ